MPLIPRYGGRGAPTCATGAAGPSCALPHRAPAGEEAQQAPVTGAELSPLCFQAEWLPCQKQGSAMLPPQQMFPRRSLGRACELERAGAVRALRALAG